MLFGKVRISYVIIQALEATFLFHFGLSDIYIIICIRFILYYCLGCDR